MNHKDNIYDSLFNLDINWDSELFQTHSLGNYVTTKNNYPYIANPFLLKHNEYLSREGENIISTLNNNSLFNFLLFTIIIFIYVQVKIL